DLRGACRAEDGELPQAKRGRPDGSMGMDDQGLKDETLIALGATRCAVPYCPRLAGNRRAIFYWHHVNYSNRICEEHAEQHSGVFFLKGLFGTTVKWQWETKS